MTVASKVKQTLACLKSIESTLNTYSLQEQNLEAQDTYRYASHKTRTIIQDLEKRIQSLEFEEPQYKGY